MLQRTKINDRMQGEIKRSKGHRVLSPEQIKKNKAKSARKGLVKRLHENSLAQALSEITGLCKGVYRG